MIVSERRPPGVDALHAAVVADHERRGRLAGGRDGQLRLRELDLGRPRLDLADRLVREQVDAAAEPGREHQQRDEHPPRHAARQPEPAAARRRLPVDGDGRAAGGRKDRAAVPVQRRASAHASLQGGSHTWTSAARRSPCKDSRLPGRSRAPPPHRRPPGKARPAGACRRSRCLSGPSSYFPLRPRTGSDDPGTRGVLHCRQGLAKKEISSGVPAVMRSAVGAPKAPIGRTITPWRSSAAFSASASSPISTKRKLPSAGPTGS